MRLAKHHINAKTTFSILALTYIISGPFNHCAANETEQAHGIVHEDRSPSSSPSAQSTARQTKMIRQTANPTSYLARVSAEFEKEWPHNRQINIVFHGHSVPTGYFKTPVIDTFNAYPHLLHKALKERFPYAVINAITTSIGGENSTQGVHRFANDVLTLKPDIVTIDYSLNDRKLGLESPREAWSQMIEQALSQNVKVLLLTPTGDWNADMQSPDDPLSQHAQQVRELAAKYGVGLVDSYQSFLDYLEEHGTIKPIMAQSNHPNREGHERVLEELKKWFPGLASDMPE